MVVNSLPLANKIVKIMSSAAKSTMRCVVHDDDCVLGDAELDISGFPCVDWAPSGLMRGIYGPTFGILLALIQWHRFKRTQIIVLENVPEFNEQVLRCLMSDLWDLHFFYVCPADVACEYLMRMRLFVLCLLRGFMLLFRLSCGILTITK